MYPKRHETQGEYAERCAAAILAQPSMARVEAVVDAAVAWQEESTPLPPHIIADMTPEADLWLAVDALLAEGSDD